MAQYRVKNASHLDKAFKVYGGHQIVAAGKEDDVTTVADLTEAQIDAFARDGVKVTAVVGPLDHDADGKAGGSKPNDPPSERDELKKQAGEIGIEYAKNITTEKLKELIDAKLAA